MAKSRFKISKFTNPSGDEVFRLAGTLNGKRIRQNFKTRAEAVAERQELDIKRLNGESDGQTVWTTLTHDQNRDAIAAVNMLKKAGSKRDLSFAVHYFLQHYKEADEQILFEEALDEYENVKCREMERGALSRPQYLSILKETKRLKATFSGRIIGEVQSEEIRNHLEKPLRKGSTPSLKTWNNRRGYISTFFKYCLGKRYVAENPMIQVPQFKIKKARGTAPTFSADEVEKMMRWLETYKGKQNKNGSWWGKPGCLVPFFALAFFAGVRPDWRDGEIKKIRAQDIRFDTDVILIEPEVSKVNEKRTIKMQPNLKAWLQRYPIEEFPILPEKRMKDMYIHIREKWDLPYDVMRHTFISMTVGAFRSVGDAALQAGNSEAVIRKHYLDLKSVEEADQFWSICPKGAEIPKTKKFDGRYARSEVI